MADGKGLTKFLNEADLQELYSKKAWLNTDITRDANPELHRYLMHELNVVEADFESFVRKITEQFLQNKSDDWMIDFYSKLSGQQALWPVLKTKPIIRLDTGEHIAPYSDRGEIQVYLPVETKSKYKTVKDTLIKNENSLKFLCEFGLKNPDIHAEVKELILPKYQKNNVTKDEEYFDDFKKILDAYDSIPSNEREHFKDTLLRCAFILSVESDAVEHSLEKPSAAYLNTDELREFFKEHHPVHFVSSELLEKFGEEKVTKFLKDLGVEDKPRRIKIQLTLKELIKLRDTTYYSREENTYNYEYDGLEDFMNNGITSEKSFLLWKLLLKNIEDLNSRGAEEFFQGAYEYFYYTPRKKPFAAKFLEMLKQGEWLVDKNNNFKKSSDIAFSELSDDYERKGSNIEILVKVLEFKPEMIEQLPERERAILKIVGNRTPEEIENIISEHERKHQGEEEKTWTPECGPDEIVPRIEDVEPDKIITPDLSNQAGSTEAGKHEKSAENENTEDEIGELLIDKKAIGDWGEKYVYNALRGEYQKHGEIIETDSGFKVINSNNEEFEIIWLNKNGDTGKGYDFCIKQNGTEVEYIEVKSKTEENPELVTVQGTQWEFARKLFDQTEGEKYSFYVVLNAGKTNATIRTYKNPIKLWKEGKIYAHPVNLKL